MEMAKKKKDVEDEPVWRNISVKTDVYHRLMGARFTKKRGRKHVKMESVHEVLDDLFEIYEHVKRILTKYDIGYKDWKPFLIRKYFEERDRHLLDIQIEKERLEREGK